MHVWAQKNHWHSSLEVDFSVVWATSRRAGEETGAGSDARRATRNPRGFATNSRSPRLARRLTANSPHFSECHWQNARPKKDLDWVWTVYVDNLSGTLKIWTAGSRVSRESIAAHRVSVFWEKYGDYWRLIDNYSTAQVLWGAHVPLGTQILKPLPYMYFRPKSVFDRVIICFHFFTVTNPIDVIKIRMQLENELGSKHSSKNIFKDRYYKGFIRGALRIFSEEGLRGLYKG